MKLKNRYCMSMGISLYTDWDKANQNDSEAQEGQVKEDLTVAFLIFV